MGEQTYNPSIQEAGAGVHYEFEAILNYIVQGQSGYNSETCLKKNKLINKANCFQTRHKGGNTGEGIATGRSLHPKLGE